MRARAPHEAEAGEGEAVCRGAGLVVRGLDGLDFRILPDRMVHRVLPEVGNDLVQLAHAHGMDVGRYFEMHPALRGVTFEAKREKIVCFCFVLPHISCIMSSLSSYNKFMFGAVLLDPGLAK